MDFVANCLNYQQVKYEHQRAGGTTQMRTIPEWKWEHNTVDFVTGSPITLDLAIGEKVLLKVSPTKSVMRFGMKEKLSTYSIRPFEILGKCRELTLANILNSEHRMGIPSLPLRLKHRVWASKVVGQVSEALGARDHDVSFLWPS
ncbi:hypothetical protein MTR67_024077 [Solanum verrucosum]|uniref:Reverse transcriptase n=1 Tax=Solanum verrucosum TaxID=315347 RepID=A0AAF0QY49_SOLVR|nr:hypothetical protein MTR67_024077 [Solanum verrucosum]